MHEVELIAYIYRLDDRVEVELYIDGPEPTLIAGFVGRDVEIKRLDRYIMVYDKDAEGRYMAFVMADSALDMKRGEKIKAIKARHEGSA